MNAQDFTTILKSNITVPEIRPRQHEPLIKQVIKVGVDGLQVLHDDREPIGHVVLEHVQLVLLVVAGLLVELE